MHQNNLSIFFESTYAFKRYFEGLIHPPLRGAVLADNFDRVLLAVYQVWLKLPLHQVGKTSSRKIKLGNLWAIVGLVLKWMLSLKILSNPRSRETGPPNTCSWGKNKITTGIHLPFRSEVLADNFDGVLLAAAHAVQQDEKGLSPHLPILGTNRQLTGQNRNSFNQCCGQCCGSGFRGLLDPDPGN